MERQIGNITFFNSAKGFGFIVDEADLSYFFHVKYVQCLANGAKPVPKVGDLFYFKLRPSTSKVGAEEAFDLELLRRADADAGVQTSVQS